MAGDDTITRTIHDVSQAAWFGGALMGAISIPATRRAAGDAQQGIRIADEAWTAWQPVSTTAIATHLIAGAGMTWANKGRLTAQAGAKRTTALKTGLTLAAMATDAWARRLGSALSDEVDRDTAGTAQPRPEADERADATRKRLRLAQWATVALTGAVVALGARMGEQQRPRNLVRGLTDRLGLAA
jgi:hypothetical protein